MFEDFDNPKAGSMARWKIILIVGYIWAIVVTIVFFIALAFTVRKTNKVPSIPKDQRIPIKGSINSTISGAAAYENTADHIPSIYYKEFDFLNDNPSKILHLIKGFKTYQQTTDYSEGPSAALMALNYLGITNVTEKDLSDLTDTGYPWKLNSHGKTATTATAMAQAMRTFNLNVETNAGTETTAWNGNTHKFEDWLKESIDKGMMVLTKHIDWENNWHVIIGFDDMGTAETADDVIIIADPYDTTDHRQDGYVIWPIERYYYLWGIEARDEPLNEYKYQYVRVSKK